MTNLEEGILFLSEKKGDPTPRKGWGVTSHMYNTSSLVSLPFFKIFFQLSLRPFARGFFNVPVCPYIRREIDKYEHKILNRKKI